MINRSVPYGYGFCPQQLLHSFSFSLSSRWILFRRQWSTTLSESHWLRPSGPSSPVMSARFDSTQRCIIRAVALIIFWAFCLHVCVHKKQFGSYKKKKKHDSSRWRLLCFSLTKSHFDPEEKHRSSTSVQMYLGVATCCLAVGVEARYRRCMLKF